MELLKPCGQDKIKKEKKLFSTNITNAITELVNEHHRENEPRKRRRSQRILRSKKQQINSESENSDEEVVETKPLPSLKMICPVIDITSDDEHVQNDDNKSVTSNDGEDENNPVTEVNDNEDISDRSSEQENNEAAFDGFDEDPNYVASDDENGEGDNNDDVENVSLLSDEEKFTGNVQLDAQSLMSDEEHEDDIEEEEEEECDEEEQNMDCEESDQDMDQGGQDDSGNNQ